MLQLKLLLGELLLRECLGYMHLGLNEGEFFCEWVLSVLVLVLDTS